MLSCLVADSLPQKKGIPSHTTIDASPFFFLPVHIRHFTTTYIVLEIFFFCFLTGNLRRNKKEGKRLKEKKNIYKQTSVCCLVSFSLFYPSVFFFPRSLLSPSPLPFLHYALHGGGFVCSDTTVDGLEVWGSI